MAKKQNDSAEHRAELARHLAGVMANPLTPTRLRDCVGNFISDEGSKYLSQIQDTAPYIERVLARGGCGYILCPGSNDGTCPGPQAHKKGGAR